MKAIAVVRVRGTVNVKDRTERTLRLLRLFKKHSCVILPATPSIMGMLKSIEDYVTYGEIDKETLKELILQRGKLSVNKRVDEQYLKSKGGVDAVVDNVIQGKLSLTDLGIKPFRLSPPRGGFEHGGIKKRFKDGGVLGYRGEKINDLIKRMI